MLPGGPGDAEMAQDLGQVIAGFECPLSLTDFAHHLPGRVALPLSLCEVILRRRAGLTQQVDRYPETQAGSTRMTVRARLGWHGGPPGRAAISADPASLEPGLPGGAATPGDGRTPVTMARIGCMPGTGHAATIAVWSRRPAIGFAIRTCQHTP